MAVALMASSAPFFCASTLLLSIFVYAAVELATFTPLYTPVECRPLDRGGFPAPTMDFFWMNMSSTTTAECWNPNPYLLRFAQRKPGQVFVRDGSELKPVGWNHAPDTELPAHGKATSASTLELSVPMAEAIALLAMPSLQLIFNAHGNVEVRPRLLGVEMSTSTDSDGVCGFEFRMSTQTLGPTQCAPTVGELVIPDVDLEPPSVERLDMKEQDLAEQELKKNAAFGSILAISLLGAAVLAALGARRMRTQLKARDVKVDGKTPPQSGVECEGQAV